jgi:hypothetical protein
MDLRPHLGGAALRMGRDADVVPNSGPDDHEKPPVMDYDGVNYSFCPDDEKILEYQA